MQVKGEPRAPMGLDALLREAIEALAVLDAGRIEEIAGVAELAVQAGQDGVIEWPESLAEWRRAAASHWVLGHLAGATGRQLGVQRRIAGERVGEYRPERDAQRAAKLNAGLSWPGGKRTGRRS